MLAVLGLTLSAAFAAVAVYVLLVEHPARGYLEPAGQLTQWKPSYARGAVMQASIAVAAAIVGITGWARWHDGWMLGGAAAMLGAVAYTFAVMWALNGRIKATTQATAETAAMLERWGRLHAGRTALGLLSFACFGIAAYRAVSV